jgi:hypothetical protein
VPLRFNLRKAIPANTSKRLSLALKTHGFFPACTLEEFSECASEEIRAL